MYGDVRGAFQGFRGSRTPSTRAPPTSTITRAALALRTLHRTSGTIVATSRTSSCTTRQYFGVLNHFHCFFLYIFTQVLNYFQSFFFFSGHLRTWWASAGFTATNAITKTTFGGVGTVLVTWYQHPVVIVTVVRRTSLAQYEGNNEGEKGKKNEVCGMHLLVRQQKKTKKKKKKSMSINWKVLWKKLHLNETSRDAIILCCTLPTHHDPRCALLLPLRCVGHRNRRVC